MLKFGTDPEYFASDSSGNVVSPALLEKDNIIKPIMVDEEYKHPIYIDRNEYSWMMDGVAFELTCKKPFQTARELHHLVNLSLEDLEEFITKLSWKDQLHLCKKPVINIKPEWYLPYLESDFRVYQGFIFGCDRDYDAIEINYKCETQDVSKHLFRYGGGHFHLSGLEEFSKFPKPTIQLLAITVGNFCIANSIFPDLDRKRGQTYGKPGRFRTQNYSNGDTGIEYRSPSNSWLSLNLEKKELMFEYAKLATHLLLNPTEGMNIIEEFLNPTVDAIVNVNVDAAKNILKELE